MIMPYKGCVNELTYTNSPADFSKDDFYNELLATTIFEVGLAVAKTHLHPVHTSQSFPQYLQSWLSGGASANRGFY